MKNYAKVGNKPGRPAYRTPAQFRYKKFVETTKIKSDFIYPKKKVK